MKRRRAYLIFLLTITMVLSSVAVSGAATQAELDAARQRAAQARDAQKEAEDLAAKLAAETKALDEKISSLESEVHKLDPEISDASSRTSRLRAEVEQLRADISAKEATIDATQAEYERQQALLGSRMTSSYKQGDLFYLELLLGARDFGDLIARTTLVQRVIESNNDIALTLASTKVDLETAKAELDRNLTTVSAKRAEAEAVEKHLREMRGARQAVVNQQQSVQNQKNAMMEAAEKDASRMKALAEEEEREAAKIASAMRASQGGGVYNGVMQWPVPGGTLSSGYGWRIHPIFGTKKFHHGIDIAARSGSNVVAAASGTVIKASYGWNGGYGNVLWIDHGDGVVTTYNHLLNNGILVSSGQTVTKGQHVAEVGSTGYSTGAHLHFEVRVWNGSEYASKNPMNYLQ